MKTSIRLSKYKWHTSESVRVTGYAWAYGQFLEQQLLAEHTATHLLNFDHFVQWCNALNGSFSIVIEQHDEVWAAVSHTWSYPLYYTISRNIREVGDSPLLGKRPTQKLIGNKDALSYFLTFGVTPGNSTLLENSYLIRPGEKIRLTKSNLESVVNHPFPVTKEPAGPEQTDALLKKVIDRYAPLLRDHQILVPLTSGYDSRLLACLIKEAGYTNVLCATWGRAGNSEAKTAAEVAARLGYAYREVIYDDEMVKDFCNRTHLEDFVDTTGHFTSMPYFQDFFALEYLTGKGIIGNNTIVLPGHPGDFVRGSHVTAEMEAFDPKHFASTILDKFSTGIRLTKQQHTEVTAILMEFLNHENPDLTTLQAYELWDYQERQCKFIANSTLAYSYFDIAYAQPLFDLDLLHHFLALPGEQRFEGLHYRKVAETVFERNGVAFGLKSENRLSAGTHALKQMVKAAAPDVLKKWYYPSEDTIFYKEITHILKEAHPHFTFINADPPHRYNAYIVQWYLQLITNNFPAEEEQVKD